MRLAVEPASGGCVRGWAKAGGVRLLRGSATLLLNLLVAKPVAIYVWWISERANRMTFHRRLELARLVKRARKEGRPVLFVSNHLSMFDDPVVPMAIYRTGPRAAWELASLLGLLIGWWWWTGRGGSAWLPGLAVPAFAAGLALLGARKTWWSVGDLVNFSGVSALRGKIEGGRDEPISALTRALLAVGDPIIYFFMRSPSVKTIFVDRREGERARRTRANSVAQTIEKASRGEPVWFFFEGGRSRDPERIQPARAGIGRVILGLEGRGIRPVVIAVHHRGLERVMPIGSRRWIRSGNRIDVRWSRVTCGESETFGDAEPDPQRIADRIREDVVTLQSAWRSDREAHA